MPKSLQEFYNNKDMRENVFEYILQFYKDEAVRMMMIREQTVALADAVELLDKAFENLNIIFEPKPEGRNNIPEAR